MEKEENKVIEDVQIPVQDDNITVDNNTELDASDYNPNETGNPAPVEDPTLATTDEIIPAPVDIAGEEPIADPVVDPIIPEDPSAITPAEPVENPELVPTVNDVVPGTGDETPVDGCDGTCGVEPSPCESPVTVANFFGTLQECVTIVWRYHLKTRKHHVHVDLNDFYKGALNKIDNIIEQYQGIVGIIEDPFTNCVVGEGKDEITYLQELKNFIETNKCVLGEHSEINSSIDDFLGLIDSTLYKLTSFCEHAVKSFDEFCYEDFSMNESCCHKIPKFSKGPEEDEYGKEEDEEPAEEE